MPAHLLRPLLERSLKLLVRDGDVITHTKSDTKAGVNIENDRRSGAYPRSCNRPPATTMLSETYDPEEYLNLI